MSLETVFAAYTLRFFVASFRSLCSCSPSPACLLPSTRRQKPVADKSHKASRDICTSSALLSASPAGYPRCSGPAAVCIQWSVITMMLLWSVELGC